MAKRLVTIVGQGDNGQEPITAQIGTFFRYGEPSSYEAHVKRLFANNGWDIISLKLERGAFSYTVQIAIEAYVNSNFSLIEVRREATRILSNIMLYAPIWGNYPLLEGVHVEAFEKPASQIKSALTESRIADKIADTGKAIGDDVREVAESGLAIPLIMGIGLVAVLISRR